METEGTPGDDDLVGTDGDDVITGFGGNDTITAGPGADTVYGGNGNDRITGSNSAVAADEAVDSLSGGNGDDTIFAGLNDQVDGGNGFDRVTLSGGDGSEPAHDIDLSAQRGDLFLLPGGGRVVGVEAVAFRLSFGADRFVGGTQGVEVDGQNGADTLAGGRGDDVLTGGIGVDLLTGGGGNDTLQGYEAAPEGDVMRGGQGDDVLNGGAGDTLDGGAGTDRFTLTFASDTAALTVTQANPGADIVVSNGTRVRNCESGLIALGNGDDSVTIAGPGLEVVGGRGNDTIVGSAFDDVMEGGEGSDVFVGGDGIDTVRFERSVHVLPITVDLRITGPQNTDWLWTDTFSSIENVTGNRLTDDSLTGDGGGNVLSGLDGRDTLTGGGGNDTLVGDRLDATFPATNDDDVLSGGAGRDVIIGGAGGDTATGGAGNDTFRYLAITDLVGDGDGAVETIADLQRNDLIDLAAIDAVAGSPVDDAFTLVGGRTNTAGSAYWTYSRSADISRLWLVDGSDTPRTFIEMAGDQRGFDNFLL